MPPLYIEFRERENKEAAWSRITPLPILMPGPKPIKLLGHSTDWVEVGAHQDDAGGEVHFWNDEGGPARDPIVIGPEQYTYFYMDRPLARTAFVTIVHTAEHLRPKEKFNMLHRHLNRLF